jgi:hypothetical protein
MAAIRASMLVLALVALVALAETRASAAPAPRPRPATPYGRKAAFARMQRRLAGLGVNWIRLTWEEDRRQWRFACGVGGTTWETEVENTSTDKDGFEAIARVVLEVEAFRSAQERGWNILP